MTDELKKFYPTDGGQTKQEVVESIIDRIENSDDDEDDWANVTAPDISKLTDERMQQFVDDWDRPNSGGKWETMDAIGTVQEQVLKRLAADIAKD